MCLNCCHLLAPSTFAASYKSLGIDCNPPKAITIIKGNPNQILVKIHAIKASKGWLNHSIVGILKNLVKAMFIAPYS